MSNHPLALDENLYTYLLAHGLRETPVQQGLREATRTHEWAVMQICPERWPPWCRRRASTSRALMRAIRGAHPAGALRASKFTPGEFVTACSRRTTDGVDK